MAYRYGEIAFTDRVKAVQEEMGSRSAYARREANVAGTAGLDAALGSDAAAFIAARDSFYMATVSESGWPYIQHRGGPAGFVRVLDERTLGFADFGGNRQYVSVGNLAGDDRVALFFMDYANQARLKMFGRARTVPAEDADTLARLAVPGYRARVERGVLIAVEAFDWNCSQHITPRYTLVEVEAATAALRRRIAELEAERAAGATSR